LGLITVPHTKLAFAVRLGSSENALTIPANAFDALSSVLALTLPLVNVVGGLRVLKTFEKPLVVHHPLLILTNTQALVQCMRDLWSLTFNQRSGAGIAATFIYLNSDGALSSLVSEDFGHFLKQQFILAFNLSALFCKIKGSYRKGKSMTYLLSSVPFWPY
jgi:hypothetical protein